jgi:hypothetical protein
VWSGKGVLGKSPKMVRPLKMIPWEKVEYKEELGDSGERNMDGDSPDWWEEVESEVVHCRHEIATRVSKDQDSVGEQEWSVPKKKKAIAKKKGFQGQAHTRHSSKIARDGIPISEKAAKRVKRLNNILGNSYAIFNNIDHTYLGNLAKDAGISMGNSEEEIKQQLEVFRAQEPAQLAIDKFEKESRRNKERVAENGHGVMMGIRGVRRLSPKNKGAGVGKVRG